MRKRRFTSLIGLATVGVLAAAGCAEQTAAVRVGDSYMSRSDFTDWLHVFEEVVSPDVERGAYPDPIGGVDGSYSQAFVTDAAQFRIDVFVAGQVAEDLGIEVTEDDRRATRQGLEQAPWFASLSDGDRDRLVDDYALAGVLERALGPVGIADEIQERVAAADDIRVSSRIGRWDAEINRVVPPDGPAVDLDGPDDLLLDTGPVAG